MDIKQNLIYTIRKHENDKLFTGETNISLMAEECLKEIEKLEKKLKACEVRNKKYFEYEIYTRKNGVKFIKILIYSNEHCGYVEVGRINLSKNEWVQNTFNIEDVLDDVRS